MRQRPNRKTVRVGKPASLLLNAEQAALTCAMLIKKKARFSVTQSRGRTLVICREWQALEDSYEEASRALQEELYGLQVEAL